MKKLLFLFASLTLLFSSCKKDKDEDNDPSAINKENLSGNYVLVSAIAKSGILQFDITQEEDIIPACTLDDVLTLKPDFTLTSTDAGVTCPTNGNVSGTWSLPNDSTIVLEGETFTITQFDGRNLALSYTTDFPPFGQIDVLTTFRKQ